MIFTVFLKLPSGICYESTLNSMIYNGNNKFGNLTISLSESCDGAVECVSVLSFMLLTFLLLLICLCRCRV